MRALSLAGCPGEDGEADETKSRSPVDLEVLPREHDRSRLFSGNPSTSFPRNWLRLLSAGPNGSMLTPKYHVIYGSLQFGFVCAFAPVRPFSASLCADFGFSVSSGPALPFTLRHPRATLDEHA